MKTLKLSSDRTMYSEYADITIENFDGYWKLSFTHCKYDELVTIQEFENYLIGMENS